MLSTTSRGVLARAAGAAGAVRAASPVAVAAARTVPLALATRAPRVLPAAARAFSSSHPARSGLTNLFDTSESPQLSVHKLTPKGFILSDGLVIPGGCVFADGRVFLWDVDPPVGDGSQGIDKAWAGWAPERFAVFERLVPRPGAWGRGRGRGSTSGMGDECADCDKGAQTTDEGVEAGLRTCAPHGPHGCTCRTGHTPPPVPPSGRPPPGAECPPGPAPRLLTPQRSLSSAPARASFPCRLRSASTSAASASRWR